MKSSRSRVLLIALFFAGAIVTVLAGLVTQPVWARYGTKQVTQSVDPERLRKHVVALSETLAP